MSTELESLLEELIGGDDDRAELATAGIASMGQVALPALQPLLESRDVDARWWALRTLAQMDEPPLEWLIQGLKDESAEVRQCSALGICHHPTERAVDDLLALLQDVEPVSSNLAASALIRIGKAATQDLLDKLDTLKGTGRIEAMRALATLEDTRAISALMAGTEEDSLLVNHWAEEGLKRLGLDMVYLQPD